MSLVMDTGSAWLTLSIVAWGSRTWAFDSANFLPALRPRGREPGLGAFADQL